jgi:hypothetical protein
MRGGNRTQTIQLMPLPHAMPAHMNTVKKVTFLNCPEDEEVSDINHDSDHTRINRSSALKLSDYGMEREPLETGVTFSPRGVDHAPFSPAVMERRETRPLKKRVVTELDAQEPVVLAPRATRAKNQYINLHENMKAFNSLSSDISKPVAKKPTRRLSAAFHRLAPSVAKKADETQPAKRSSGRPRKTPVNDTPTSEASPFPRSLAFTFDFGDDNHDYFTLLSDMEVASDQGQITQESIEAYQSHSYDMNDFLAPIKPEDTNVPVDWQNRHTSANQALTATTPSQLSRVNEPTLGHHTPYMESAKPTMRSIFRSDPNSSESNKGNRKGTKFNDTYSLTPEPLEHFDSFLASLQLHLGFEDEAYSQEVYKFNNANYEGRPVPLLHLPIPKMNA